MSKRKIVIITPVRDEAWILERFLLAVSEIADHVLVLDQQSEDQSREICARFPKVTVIKNPSGDYAENTRSKIMVESARTLFGAGNVLVALDADEILASDSLQPAAWEKIRALEPGDVICMEKVEMLVHPARGLRTFKWFPFGLVDDGSPFEGRLIHSNRVPLRPGAPRYHAADLKVMHFARLRPVEYAARQAFYCMVENVNRSKTHRVRNCFYSPRFFLKFGVAAAEPCPPEWFVWFTAKGIDLWSYRSERFNSFHKRALFLFERHGSGRFRWDDIWWEDWEAARQHFVGCGVAGIPAQPLRRPGRLVRFGTGQLLGIYGVINLGVALARKLVERRESPVLDV